MTLLYFLLLIGPLVFFHELGHFLVARRFGVKCEQFAIGFGPRLFAVQRGETEYSVRALPLGGYVSMLGAHPDEEIPEEDEGRALFDKPIWQRSLIILAGPIANLLIPIPIAMFVLFSVEERVPPIVGTVLAGSPAQEAGIEPGDEIVSINGEPVRFFDQIAGHVRDNAGQSLRVEVSRAGETTERQITPATTRVQDRYLGLRVIEIGRIGVDYRRYASVVDVTRGSPAWDAGLRPFDKVIAVDGQEVGTWLDLRELLATADEATTLALLRPERAELDAAILYHETPIILELPALGAAIEASGLRSAQQTIFAVVPGTPADEAGLRPGDRIVSVGRDDRAEATAYNDLTHLIERMVNNPDLSFSIEFERDGERQTTVLTPRVVDVVADFKQEREQVFVGLRPRAEYGAPELRAMTFLERLRYAFVGGFARTFEMIGAVVLGVWYMIVGTVDSSSLGGPIMIADIASRAGSAGIEPFLRIMGLISINLGILNLLPIPGLDGGQLMLFGIEAVKRGPLSLRARQIANFIGIAMILLLILFAFKNDIERYWEDIANWLNS